MRLIVHTGSGGAGTTTVVAATAQALAARGHRVLVGAVDDADDLADCLAGADPPDHGGRLRILPDELSRPRADGGPAQDLMLTLLARGGLDPAVADEVPLLPGMGELRALFRLLDVAQRTDAEVLVLDLGPLRSAVDLLILPTRLEWMLRRLIAAAPEFGSTLRPLALLTGARPATAARAISQILARAETIARILRSEQTRLRLVIGPGPGTAE